MLTSLPGWVVDDVTSVHREVAAWRDLSAAERWHLAKLCSRASMWAVRAGAHPERVLAHVDAMPASTVAALARLRREAGWGNGDP